MVLFMGVLMLAFVIGAVAIPRLAPRAKHTTRGAVAKARRIRPPWSA
jgi:hypothetical protein